MSSLFGRDLITTQDWTIDELNATIELAKKFKKIRRNKKLPPKILERKSFFMLFYAPSTRTRAAFETGMELLGGHAAYIDASTTRGSTGEALKDMGKTYDIYADGLGVRILDEAIDFVYGQGRKAIEELAKVAKKPVINLACCTYHPTQGIGDVMTFQEKLRRLRGKKYAIMWAYSSRLRGKCSIQEEVLVATRYGMDVVLAHPEGFDIDPEIVETAKRNARENCGDFSTTENFEEGLQDAHVVFPRSWVSRQLSSVGAKTCGIHNELATYRKLKNWRLEQYHVDDLMNKQAFVAHVLPAFREEEATSEVLDGSNSIIYQQAENNLYAKMAVLAMTLCKNDDELIPDL